MFIHDPAAIEIRFEEMHDAVFCRGGGFHQCFFVFDLEVGTEALIALLLGAFEVEG